MNAPIRVFATCDIGEDALEILRGRGFDLEVYPDPAPPPKELLLEKVRSGVAVLITTLRDRVDRELLETGRGSLRLIAQDAVGYDNIDRAAANECRIPFTNTAEVLTEAVAEFALFLLGHVARKLRASERLVDSHEWGAWHPYLPLLGDEVTGKTLALIGFGRIGKAFLKKAISLDLDFVVCDPVPPRDTFLEALREEQRLRYRHAFTPRLRTIRTAPLEEAIASGDFVSLHVPLILPGTYPRPTYHLINEDTLALMKPTAYLINTSRGPVVDEKALVGALRAGRLAGAALDVFEKEPLPADSPLRDPDVRGKLSLFHHFASGTKETRLSTDPAVGMAGRTVQAVLDFFDPKYGGQPARMPYVVNREAFGR